MHARLEEVLSTSKERYADHWRAALLEGTSPLARIALSARIARQTHRFVQFRVSSSRDIVENGLRVVENIASGEPPTTEEAWAADGEHIKATLAAERSGGGEVAAEAGWAVVAAARCLEGNEFVFSENVNLASMANQGTVQKIGRRRQESGADIREAVFREFSLMEADHYALIRHGESHGDPWRDSGLGDRGWGWNDRVIRLGIPAAGSERWRRVLSELSRESACFYPPTVFGPLAQTADPFDSA